MSTDGIQQQYIPASLDGLVYVDVDGLTVNGVPVDLDNLVPYTNATKNLNLGTFNFQTLGAVSAKQHVFPPFTSTLMTSAMTSSIFTADAWGFANTISTVSLSPTVTASYLTLNNITTNTPFITFQNDGSANFANTKVRVSTMASNVYDVVNLSTLQASVAFIENVNALNYVPYTGATDNLNMGASTITTTGLIHAGALRITSSVVNADYTLSVNSGDQLEFKNLSNGSIFKTNGNDLFVSGDITCATLGSNDVSASGSFYLAKTSPAEWRTTLGMSDEYEILDNAGVMRLRLSKTTGLTVSTMNITNVPSLTPSVALGLNGGGQVVSFAVPTATNILPLANTFTNTNTFNSTLTTAVGQTTSINGALTTSLNDLGFTSASFTTVGVTGAYTPPLGTITNPSGSTYQIAQTAQGRSIMAISGFTPSVGITYVFEFNINCTIGTATISVEQDNILVSPALYQLTTGFNRVVGSFTYNGTPNTVVFKIYTGVASWNAQWNSFTLSTYSVGLNANMNALTVNNRFTQRYNALPTDVSTLVNRATMDAAIGTPANFSAVSIGSVPYESASNVFSNSLITQGTASLGYSGASFTASTGIASITFASPTYSANSNASVQGIITLPALPSIVIGLPCIATITASAFPVFAVAPYPYFTLTNGATVVYTSPVGSPGTVSMPFTPTSTTLFITLYFKSPPTGFTGSIFTWTNFTITTPSMTTTGFSDTTGRNTVGELVVSGLVSKTGTTTGYNMTINGGNTTNSPFLEFFANGTRRSYMGNVNTTQVQIAAENGAQLELMTAGSLRVAVKADGTTTHTAGDQSYMNYGANATWAANLIVGATPDKSGVKTAQVITTNGNLHLDAGNSNDIYYGFYANSRGTPNGHRFYGTNYIFDTIPENSAGYARVMCLDGGTLRRGQCMQKRLYQNGAVAWGGGINLASAFYKWNQTSVVRISGKYSGYWTSGYMAYVYVRIYSQSTGGQWGLYLPTFTNNAYNHVTIPFDIVYDGSELPATGWFDLYIANSSGITTDGNDQFTVNVSVLPANSF